MRFFSIQIISFIFFLGIQIYLYRSFRVFLGSREVYRKFQTLLTTFFLIFGLPLVIGLVLKLSGIRTPTWVTVNILPPVYLWHLVSLLLFFVLMAGKLLKLPFLTLGWMLGRFERTTPIVRAVADNPGVQRFDARRRQVMRQGLTTLTGAMALGSVYDIYRKDTFETTTIRLPVTNLPMSFHGFSIGFISDIHSGIFMSGERMRSYAEAVNGIGADMIVVTGDFVNSQIDEVHPLREAFSILSAEYGVFGVLGNHDFYTRKVDEVAGEIERAGISLLRNRHLEIRKNGEAVHLAGVDDTGNETTAARYFRSVNGAGASPIPRILLCHRPYFFPDAAAAGFDLVLAGHTHGGQVVLGELGTDVLAPARLVSPYVAGIYAEGGSRMYVSRGIGTVGVPFRLNCPPEITKIVLERADIS